MSLSRGIVAALAVGALACGGQPPQAAPPPPMLTLRELPEPALRPFSLTAGAPIETLTRSGFSAGRAQPASAWTPGAAGIEPAQFVYREALAAEPWLLVTATFHGRVAGGVELAWSGTGDCREARLAPQSSTSPAAGAQTALQFLPGVDPCWTGTIQRLRLETGGGAAHQLTELVVSRPARLAEFQTSLGQGSWRIRLGNELRSGFFAPPGAARTWTIPPGPAGVLRLAFGVAGPTRGSARFQVRLRSAAGTATLLDELAGGSSLAPDRWHERWIDLPAAAGARRLDFESTPQPGAVALGFWEGAELRPVDSGAPRPNLVLISIDTLRADRLSVYGNSRPTSPAIDGWARAQGVVFRRAIAQAPWTLPSHTTMLTGLDPLRHGVNSSLPAAQELVTLAERLRAAGYRTQAVTGGAWMSPAFGLDQGFDAYSFSPSQDDREIELHRGVARALEFLRSGDRRHPYFLFFHTYAVHGPQRAQAGSFERWSRFDPKLRTLESADELDPASGLLRAHTMQLLAGAGRGREPLPAELAGLPFDLYDSSVAAMDHELAELLAATADPEDGRAAFVVLTSDHGETLGEHGRGGHNNLFDTTLHVPLIVRAPGIAPTTIESQVRLVDITPTLLDAAGLESGPADGRSLLPLLAGRAEPPREAWSYSATGDQTFALYRTNGLKAIATLNPWLAASSPMQLFDLRRDPGENADLANRQGRVVATVAEEVERRSRGMGQGIFFTVHADPAASAGPLQLAVSAPELARGRWRPLRGGATTVEPLVDGTSYRLTVPPGASAEFWLESARELAIEALPGPSRVAARIAPAFATAAIRYCLTNAGWVLPAAGGTCVDSVTLFRRLGATAPSAATDPQLEEQLRALGYLR